MNLVDECIAIPTPCLIFLHRTASVLWVSCSMSWGKFSVMYILLMESLLLGEYVVWCSFVLHRSLRLLLNKFKRSISSKQQGWILTAVPLWVRNFGPKVSDNSTYLQITSPVQVFIVMLAYSSPCRDCSTFQRTFQFPVNYTYCFAAEAHRIKYTHIEKVYDFFFPEKLLISKIGVSCGKINLGLLLFYPIFKRQLGRKTWRNSTFSSHNIRLCQDCDLVLVIHLSYTFKTPS